MSAKTKQTPIRIGVAGWSLPATGLNGFPDTGSHLERYAARFNAVEINSSFYRPHRTQTYRRWAESVPSDFRFAVKLPKAITHERRFESCEDLLARFLAETAGLEAKRGPVLVQLPPSFRFPGTRALRFLEALAEALTSPVVLEPRHASWFTAEVDSQLAAIRIARVGADPGKPSGAEEPGGWRGFNYFRLHGSPEIYKSPYSAERIDKQAVTISALAAQGTESWTIFDNTTFGAATVNALDLQKRVA